MTEEVVHVVRRTCRKGVKIIAKRVFDTVVGAESVVEAAAGAATDAVAETVVEAATETVIEAAAGVVSESLVDAATGSIADAASESLVETARESLAETVAQVASESVAESAAKAIEETAASAALVSEAVVEAAAEAATESIVETTAKSVVEAASETAATEVEAPFTVLNMIGIEVIVPSEIILVFGQCAAFLITACESPSSSWSFRLCSTPASFIGRTSMKFACWNLYSCAFAETFISECFYCSFYNFLYRLLLPISFFFLLQP